VTEGGALRVYSTTTSAEIGGSPIAIIGTAVDVKAVDQAQ